MFLLYLTIKNPGIFLKKKNNFFSDINNFSFVPLDLDDKSIMPK